MIALVCRVDCDHRRRVTFWRRELLVIVLLRAESALPFTATSRVHASNMDHPPTQWPMLPRIVDLCRFDGPNLLRIE